MNGIEFQQAWAEALREAREHIMFSALNEAQFDQLISRARLQTLDANSYLFMQGDEAQRFFYVVEGRIKLFRVSLDGQEKVMEVITAGNTFAEAVMFMDKNQYPVNSQAMSRTRVLSFSGPVYKKLLQQSPDCCFKMMGSMATKLHMRVNEIETLSMQNARHRLVRFLINQLPNLRDSSAVIELPMPKRLIASRLAMQPETLSRIMHDLKEQEILSVEGKRLTIHDVEGLKSYCQ